MFCIEQLIVFMSLLVLNSLQDIVTALPKSSSNNFNSEETELSESLKFDDDLESNFFITESEFKVLDFFLVFVIYLLFDSCCSNM